MSVKDEEFKTKIYDLMNGSYNLEEYPVEESSVVTVSYTHLTLPTSDLV